MNKSFIIALALILALIKQSSAGLTQAQRDLILKSHNDIRGKTARGETSGFQTASKMYPLVWDDTLAQLAQGTADKCQQGHDQVDTSQRYCLATGGSNCGNAFNEWAWTTDAQGVSHGEPKYAVGQNFAWSYSSGSNGGSGSTGQGPTISGTNWGFDSNSNDPSLSWGSSGSSGSWSSGGFNRRRRRLLQTDQDTSSIQTGLNGWISEDQTDGMYSGDHFTQMVADRTRKVGCGYKDCGGSGRFFYCDYLPFGNLQGKPAYTIGTAGSSCPNGANNGLCK